MKQLLPLLAVLITLVACDDENGNNVTPTKTKLLTVQVDAGYPTENYNDWIVVHGEDGELLAFESLEANSVVELETEMPVNGNITTTTIRHGTSPKGFNFYNVKSHYDVPTGKTMVFKNTLPASLGVTGNLKVSISDVTALEQQSLSSRIGAAGSSSWSSGTNILQINTATHAGITKYIASVDDKSSLKYKVLENVKPNDEITFSFLDMLSYDNTITFNFPATNDVTLFVIGSEQGANLIPNNYTLQSYYANTSTRGSQRAGYLNSFTNYRTLLTITYPDHVLEYVNFGSVPNPNGIVWPVKSDFSVTTTTINNYKASAKKPFAWRSSTWTYLDDENSVNWTVCGPGDHQTIGELPAEIISQHPELALSKMTYSSTTFYTDAMSYDVLVNSDFASNIEVPGSRVGIKTKGN